VRLFDPLAENPFLVAAGDYLSFVAIRADEYRVLKEQVDSGNYTPIVSTVTTGGPDGVHGN
jgi:hypothetical protein